jgi:hypothetical protein
VAPRGGSRGGGRPRVDSAEKYVTRSISFPPQLLEQIDKRREALGYRDRSAYLQALAVADIRGGAEVIST